MGYSVRMLKDSLSPDGVRLSTMEVTLPRIVLAEFNTHRMLSRNSASSRAIPVEKRIAAVRADPFVPEAFAANQRGMQAGDALDDAAAVRARESWLGAMNDALFAAEQLAGVGVHKQWANRVIEPYCWHTIIASATEWANFFALRCSPEAQPEIRRAAEMMRDCLAQSTPEVLRYDGWHLPFIDAAADDELFIEDAIRVSVARCARVSYLTHDGRRDVAADLALYDRLLASGHMSPFEHVARPAQSLEPEFVGNFRGWVQHRKLIPGEAVFTGGSR